jgi:hypothetical protein
MGMISRIEPGIELIEANEDYYPTFQKVGWLDFLRMFNGYNSQVTKAFALSFNGEYAKVGDIELQINEEMIARVTKLSLKGECWSKTKRVKEIPWSEILISPECKYDYKGMPISLVKEKWHFLLGIIKGFITCEGRYSIFFIYHFQVVDGFHGL